MTPSDGAGAPAIARRLQLFTGKGGVGKTTLVAALALAWAERGRRPLIVELGHRASIEGVLGCAEIGWDPSEVAPGVHATSVEPARAVLEVVARWVRVRRLAARIVRAEAMQAFVAAAPAVVEVGAIERIFALLEEGWDPILLDADATGHARMFVGLPSVLVDLGAGGPLASMLARTSRLFADPGASALHLVTLPGALPIEETIELDADLRAGGRVALGEVFVSRAPRRGAVASSRALALSDRARDEGALALAGDLGRLGHELAASEAAHARIARLASAIGRPITALPDLRDVSDRDALLSLGRAALAGTLPAPPVREPR